MIWLFWNLAWDRSRPHGKEPIIQWEQLQELAEFHDHRQRGWLPDMCVWGLYQGCLQPADKHRWWVLFAQGWGMTFWEGLLQGGIGALVQPAVDPCLPYGRATSQACLGPCPEKAEGEASGSNSWNSSLVFIVLWKRKRVVSDGLWCPFELDYFTSLLQLLQTTPPIWWESTHGLRNWHRISEQRWPLFKFLHHCFCFLYHFSTKTTQVLSRLQGNETMS